MTSRMLYENNSISVAPVLPPAIDGIGSLDRLMCSEEVGRKGNWRGIGHKLFRLTTTIWRIVVERWFTDLWICVAFGPLGRSFDSLS